ncbi:putative flavin-containing monooxygenase 1 [Dorcoceras hygrometricum]|uniref:Putative flavin-containing monooxygenase 1 n=1 Tax=Dorcoceras hygrometricum TaxID=472368 RepID=A0A2Z6ZUK5_9LAMI|nr:putative flavin-containing monooxygenase 1 [Dorcoceras hygrometricum]
MEESMAEIKSCKLPGIKGTRFVLFWEIVQFTEERCTYLERRQFGLDKRRRDLNSLSNGHIRTEGFYTRIFEGRRLTSVKRRRLLIERRDKTEGRFLETKQQTAIRKERLLSVCY